MDKRQFRSRFSKIMLLNRRRYELATSIMRKSVLELLNLVPIFLHYNDPRIPGYRDSDVPYGIDMFSPNAFQSAYLQKKGIDPTQDILGHYPIYALYTMGSTSSIAQSPESDLDIWVCVRKNLPQHEMNLLVEKCKFISLYAKTQGTDINLFVTPENRFISGEHGNMDTEDCGSAQSLFLLDEFYRSSIRLCGRYISWYMISVEEEEQNYNAYLEDFYNSEFVNNEEWFDFGSVAKCSPVEYFGSGLWLVYKGIDRPFKAVLKILLMEAYASEYPNTRLLSLAIKQRIYQSQRYSLSQDAYYVMFKKVSRFLAKIEDRERLQLARTCFYLKVHEACTNLNSTAIYIKRCHFLEHLIARWNWNRFYIDGICANRKRNAFNAGNLHQDLLRSLLRSYQALLKFSVNHGIEYAITSDDAGVLSRKIYTAIDRYPGKIMLYYKDFLAYRDAENLSLIRPSFSGSLSNDGWHVYPCAADSVDLLQSPCIYFAKKAVEMVAWLSINNVLNSLTKISFGRNNGQFNAQKVQNLSFDIKRFFKNSTFRISSEDLNKPRSIVKSLIILNFENDITPRFMISNSDLEVGNTLSCGRQKMCLIGSVEVIDLNSWGEIVYHSYHDGEQGIVELLASLLKSSLGNEISRAENFGHVVRVRSYSSVHGEIIRYDCEKLIKNLCTCLNSDVSQGNFPFRIGHNIYEARKEDEHHNAIIVRKSLFRSADDEVTILSKYGMRPEYALQVPAIIERHATFGIMQYFFSKEKNTWNIYIVNERNEVNIYYGFKGSRAALVNSINRFYTAQSEKDEWLMNFNLPQYFVLSPDHKAIHPFTISSSY